MSEETALIVRTSEQIAAEIVAIKTETFRFLETATAFATRQSFEIGNRLIEAKKLVDPGKWTEWLKESVEYSEDTAQNLMRIAREYNPENPSVQAMSYSQLVAMFPVPASERESFIINNDVGELSAREIKKLIRDKEAAEKRLRSFDKISADREKLKNDLSAMKQTAERDRQMAYRLSEEKEKLEGELKKLREAPPKVEKVIETVPGEVTEEQLQALRSEIRAEYDGLLEQEAKDKMRQDPLVVEVNLYFRQLQNDLQSMSEALEKIDQDKREKLSGVLVQTVRQILVDRFGISL